MKKVVLFKSESEEYRSAFSGTEYSPVFVEPLQFEEVNGESLAAALSAPYAGLVVTSVRAVDAVARRWDPALFVQWSARRVYAVGEASAARCQAALGLTARGHATGNAENLARLILQENPSGSKFLFPCGNLRSETLPAALDASGMSVDALTVYETVENVNLKSNLMELSTRGAVEGTGAATLPCALVFFSPSGCEYIHRELQTFSNELAQLPHFAIGNSTAHKIETLGLEIAGVAAKPRPDSLIHSIHKYFVSL